MEERPNTKRIPDIHSGSPSTVESTILFDPNGGIPEVNRAASEVYKMETVPSKPCYPISKKYSFTSVYFQDFLHLPYEENQPPWFRVVFLRFALEQHTII